MMLFGVEKSKIVRQEARFCGVIPIAHLKAPVQIVRCCFCCLYYTIPKMSSGALATLLSAADTVALDQA